MISNLFILFFISVLSIRTVYSISGCVPLDSFSFEKVVSKFNAALIKFDGAYPYGKKQDEYEKVCTAGRNIDDLLVAEVAIKDYGEKDNADLAERFNIKKDDHPVVKLFVKGTKEPLTFKAETEDDFTEENLKAFIRSKSNVYIGLLGCLQEFDTIAEKFSKEKNKDARKKLLLEAEKIWDAVKGGQNQKSAEVYVKYMRKTLEVGDEFIGTETNRIKNIIKGKVSENKKEELEQKINILKAFSVKDEL